MKIKWHNRPETVTKEIEKKAMDRLDMAGKYIEIKAKQYCPVGVRVPRHGKPWTERIPGQLRDSIEKQRDDRNLTVRVKAGGYMPFYAYWVETGTVKMSARPYLRPATFSSAVGRIIEGLLGI